MLQYAEELFSLSCKHQSLWGRQSWNTSPLLMTLHVRGITIIMHILLQITAVVTSKSCLLKFVPTPWVVPRQNTKFLLPFFFFNSCSLWFTYFPVTFGNSHPCLFENKQRLHPGAKEVTLENCMPFLKRGENGFWHCHVRVGPSRNKFLV